jgi:hypothetical protein
MVHQLLPWGHVGAFSSAEIVHWYTVMVLGMNLWLACVGWGQMCDVIAEVCAFIIFFFFVVVPILIGGFTIIIIKR